MSTPQVKIKRLHPDAKPPIYGTAFSAGADLCSVEERKIAPGEWCLISTGIAIEIPMGYEAQVRPRSGLAFRHGVTVLNAPGTIDSDYRGEVKVMLINMNPGITYVVTRGERIAQLIIAPVKKALFEWADELSDTTRGEGGFGSTGVK